jgi:hypothetical protein
MNRGGANPWLIGAVGLVVGFLAAVVIVGDKGKTKTVAETVTSTQTTVTPSTTTPATTTPGTTSPTTAGTTPTTTTSTGPDSASCITLWNQPANRGNQVFLVNVMSQQAVRVNVGATATSPAKCLVTVVENSGPAYVFPQGTTLPYEQTTGTTPGDSLPAAQKISNALEQRDGTLQSR